MSHLMLKCGEPKKKFEVDRMYKISLPPSPLLSHVPFICACCMQMLLYNMQISYLGMVAESIHGSSIWDHRLGQGLQGFIY